MTLPLDLDSATHVILRAHFIAAIGFAAFKKPYCQHHFRSMDGSLIASLIFLGQCGLKGISFHLC